MLGVFRLESQMLPGNGKFERTGIGSDREAKEASNTAFNFLKANANKISVSISTTTKDYIINYQDLQGIGMTGRLALPTLIALCSIELNNGFLLRYRLSITLKTCSNANSELRSMPRSSMINRL